MKNVFLGDGFDLTFSFYLQSVPQIVKIINMYTASDEETVPKDFIKNLTLALQKDRHTSADGNDYKVYDDDFFEVF